MKGGSSGRDVTVDRSHLVNSGEVSFRDLLLVVHLSFLGPLSVPFPFLSSHPGRRKSPSLSSSANVYSV